jgi:hypothetical protein
MFLNVVLPAGQLHRILPRRLEIGLMTIVCALLGKTSLFSADGNNGGTRLD